MVCAWKRHVNKVRFLLEVQILENTDVDLKQMKFCFFKLLTYFSNEIFVAARPITDALLKW